MVLTICASSWFITSSPFSFKSYPKNRLALMSNSPFWNFLRKLHRWFPLMLCNSSSAKLANTVKTTSPSLDKVWIFCYSKKISIPRVFNSRLISRTLLRFLANLDIDLVWITSICPFLQASSIV